MNRLPYGIQCSRILLAILNLVFLVCGLALLGLGFYVVAHGRFSSILAVYNITQALGNSKMLWVGIGLITMGAIVTVLALSGCLGSIYKNRIILYVYAFLIVIIILLEFAAVIVLFKFRVQIWETYNNGFQMFFLEAYHFNQTQNITVIKQIEREFHCCGVDSFLDYEMIHLIPPVDCYPNQNKTARIYDDGCAQTIVIWVWDNLPYVIGFAVFVLLIQIFGIISSIVLGVISTYARQMNEFIDHTVQS